MDGLEGVKGRMKWPKIKGWVLSFFRKIGGKGLNDTQKWENAVIVSHFGFWRVYIFLHCLLNVIVVKNKIKISNSRVD